MKISFFGITAAVAAMALTLQTGKVSADALPSVSELSFQALSHLSGMPSVNPPRTKYLDSQGAPVYRNRLLLERSPYLRQHAHNPIDWRPWGDEALAEANKRGVPIFLSVGYATCHWCHVMEEESFDNVDIARTMNRNFIAVKVDRETLPQIDAQYMIATQLLRGSGGWPNNVFLTTEGAPIVSLGYEPPATFHETLQTISADWTDLDGNRAMRNQALSVAEFVNLIMRQHGEAAEIDEEVYAKGTAELLADFDNAQGGFGRTPKFPNESMVGFLLDRYERDGDTAALDAALVTLRAIAAGGIHDQVGGGFHRYAVDQNWRTPHFEKMLYTQANLTQNMLQAYRLEGDPVLGRAARRALDYVLRDMTAPNGAFYAAQDADSAVSAGGEIEEGAFYTWNFAQLERALGIGAVDGVRGVLGLDQPPTVPTGAVAHFNPQAVPDFVQLEPVLETLRNARKARPAPLTDTKIIAGWNGLMIEALAEGAIVLNEPRYLAAAERAARFIRTSMLSPRGDLARAYANGPLGEGALRDYVWLAQAHIALADATGNRDYLTIAAQLGQEILNRFKEREDAPLRYAQNPGPLGASFDVLEGANPPGNASAIELFSALANRVSDEHQGNLWNREAEALIAAMSSSIVDAPRDNISATAASASHLSGATGSKRFMGQGAATAQLFPEGGTIRLLLEFAPGWHANAEKPLGDNLIPTRFGGPGLGQVRYPSPRNITLGFQDEPLLVLEGSGEITAARIADGARQARLDIQLCNDSYCLPPETHIFRFAPLR